MKIRSVSTAVVAATYDWTIVRVETDDGHVGWGEAAFAPGLPRVVAELGELLVDADPRQVQPLVRRLYDAAGGAGSGGVVCNAISGLDAALWDLNARVLDVPLWRLFGGRVHERVRVYATCRFGNGSTSVDQSRHPEWAPAGEQMTTADSRARPEALAYERFADWARQAVSQGFDGLKFHLDLPGLLPTRPGSRMLPANGEDLASRVMSAVRRAVGSDVDLAYDFGGRYDVQSVIRLVDVAAEHAVWWLDDLLPPDNVTGLRGLGGPVPLAGGGGLVRFAALSRLVDCGAVAILTPDLGKIGGYAEARRTAEAADAAGLALAPHNVAGPIGTAFAAQVACTWPNLVALEYPGVDVPFYADLVGRPLVEGGGVEITDRPGIGVEPDLDVVRKYAKEGESVFTR